MHLVVGVAGPTGATTGFRDDDMSVSELSIAFKELVPVVLAAVTWGRQWKGMVVLCQSDNEATVAVLNTCTSRDAQIMHLLRCLFFFEAAWEFSISAAYLPGQYNDDISRGHTLSYLSKVPTAAPHPAPVSPAAIDVATEITARLVIP